MMSVTSVDRFTDNDMIALTSEKVQFDLAESVGPDLTLSEILSVEDYLALAQTRLEYGTAAGNEQLRERVAAGHGVTASDVVITVGGMHALFLIGQILVSGDEHVVVVQPSFPLAAAAMQHGRGNVSTVQCRFDNNYQLDVNELVSALTSTTRLVLVATPQNPSGVAVSTSAIKEIVAGMQSICPDAYLLIDETYREASYGEALVARSMIGISERIVVCGSLSKCHGAPGLRVGWAVTCDPWLREQLVRGKFQSVIAHSTLDELLALRTLHNADLLLSNRRTLLAEGLALVEAWVLRNEEHVQWIRPDGGALCCAALKPARYDESDVNRFYQRLAENSVRVAPGHWFGESTRIFRIGFGLLPPDVTKTALERVEHALSA